MEFREIAMKRYAAKKFDGKRIPEAKMHELLELVRLSASSFGLQPYRIKVISDSATKEKLLAAAYGQAQINTCSHLLVFCADTEIESRIDRMESELSKTGFPAEALKSYAGMMRDFASKLGQEQRLAWAQKQAYIALGNALNGAKSLGFDSCPMEGFDAKEYSRILKLPPNLVPAVLCPVGFAADQQKDKFRFSKEDLFF